MSFFVSTEGLATSWPFFSSRSFLCTISHGKAEVSLVPGTEDNLMTENSDSLSKMKNYLFVFSVELNLKSHFI